MTEFVEAILAQVIGNLSTVLIILIFYFNFLLFESYLRLIVWAILFSQALRQAKNNVISVLQYLSNDPDVERNGFLTSVFTKSREILLYQPGRGARRTGKELFLNYGIFVFSLIGAVSIWMRMYSMVSFLHVGLGVWVLLLSVIKILDRRIFYYRYFISDDVLVSLLLILGFFVTGIFVMFYLGTESYMEGSRAAVGLTTWIQKNFINDERTRKVWSEQVENSRAMISAALSGVENKYNDTMWWPPVKSLVKTYYLDTKTGDGNLTTSVPLYKNFGLPENMTLFQMVSLVYSKADSVNLTSVQLTDWTSKGIEVSSIAFGSVAQLIFLFFTLIIAFVSLGIRAFFFISSLFYLLCTNWDPIERFVEDLLPIQVDKRPQVVHSLRKVVEGVFFLPLKMSSLHALVTLVSFTLVDADFVYLATTITFLISIVPIIPPYLVCLPWVASIWVTSSFIKAIALFGVQYFAFTLVDDMLYEKSIVALNSYVSALSVVFGVYVFGFEGVIFGPLSVCAVTFAYEVSNHGIQAAKDDYSRTADTAGGFDQDESLDEPTSTGGSSFEEDDETAKVDGEAESTLEVKSPNTSIFSDAMYRVISGPLVDRVRRRLSMDISTDDSLCVTIIVEGLKSPRKVRFVVNRSWNQRALCENLRRMLHAHSIEGITASDGSEVLSPLHILPNEVLHVRVKQKHRPPLFPDVISASEPSMRISSMHAASPRVGRTLTGVGSSPSGVTAQSSMDGFSPAKSGSASPSHIISPFKSKMAVPIDLPLAQAMAAKHARTRLRRQYSVPIRSDGDGILRRRGSHSMERTQSQAHGVDGRNSAATFEDVASLLSPPVYPTVSSTSSSCTSSPGHRNGVDAVNQQTLSAPSSSTPSPKKDRRGLPDLLATPIAFDGSGSLDGPDAIQSKRNGVDTGRGESKDAEPSMPDRRQSIHLGSRSTSLLFSPLSVQDGSVVYPSDDDESKRKADHNGQDTKHDSPGPSSSSTPTKTLCFDDMKETTEAPTSPQVSKFKYVSKAKAQQYRQRKAGKDGTSEAAESDLF